MIKLPLSPSEAWEPLPFVEFDAGAARHLLRRAGWTARPDDVARAVRDGLSATLDRLFPTSPILLPRPALVTRARAEAPQYALKIRSATGDERRAVQRDERERAQKAVQDLSIKWLESAAVPENSAFAKWVLFLSDVYVVSTDKVRNPGFIYQHFDILARHALGPAPELAKAVSRSPAMLVYLDLNQSQKSAPNENFARELFELFLLGEGNYTERDIKEAARAFTGYRAQADEAGFRYFPRLHDEEPKTIFGETANFTGDEVIDLVYKQKTAGRFLPHELVTFYLSDEPLDPEYLDAIGSVWAADGYSLRGLARRFFGSRLFFAEAFRGNYIKSPVQFYLGVIQDLELDVAPLARYSLTPLRQMGQQLYAPPNVRGWVGGRSWINSGTLAARRQLVEMLFAPLDENALNADELIEIVAARTNGATRFTAAAHPRFSIASTRDPGAATSEMIERFLPVRVTEDFSTRLAKFIAAAPTADPERTKRLERAAVTLLQSPEYQLC